MIINFANKLAEDLFIDRTTKATRSFPPELHRIARRKLQYLHEAADLGDLKVPPSNNLKALSKDPMGFYSVRINDQWRLIFRFKQGNASDVSTEDYH